MKAENPLVTENLGLVHSCVRRFVGRGVEYEDLFQSGCLGLTKAAARFDASRGLKFSTYAVPVILGEIKSLFRSGTPVKVSRSIRELAARVAAESERCRSENGVSPTLQTLAELLGVSAEKIAEAIGASAPVLSLTGEEGEKEREREIPTEPPQEGVTEHLALSQALRTLSEEDRRLISLRYWGNKTQKETAGLMGSTQVQVSRREKKILLYLRTLL